jgi:hypothetical protein
MAAAVDPMTTTTFLKQIQIDRIMAEIELSINVGLMSVEATLGLRQ